MTDGMYLPWDGCETVEYRSPLGDVVTMLMLSGATGRMMPPVKVATLPVPARNGSRFLGATHLERLVSVPVVFPGSLTDRAELRRWAKALDPTHGEGTLTVVQGANAGRFLRCAYDAGMDELAEEHGHYNEGSLLFRAAWPYWQDGAAQSTTITQGTTATRWFPFLPLILGASDAFGVFTVTVAGDVASWPVVTVRGPGTDVKVENLTTGVAWQVTGALAAGATLTVDTRPGRKTVSLDGTNVYPNLTPDSVLWPLVPGANRVQISMALTDPTSYVAFEWRNQWLAA